LRYLLGLLCFAALPFVAAGQTFLQSGTLNGSNPALSNSCVFPQNNGAGDTLILAIRTPNIATVTDSQGNIWVPAGVNGAGSLWYATNSKPGANSVTISYPQSEYFQAICAEYSGLLHLDQGVQVASGNGTAAASYAISTMASGDLIVGFGNNGTTNYPGITAGTGFTMRGQVNEFLEDMIQSTPGTVTGTATYSSSVGWNQGVAAFAPGPPIPGSFLQAGSVNPFGANSLTFSCGFPGHNQAGDTLVLVGFFPASATITDTAGNSWINVTSGDNMGLWYATNAKAGANSVTVTYQQAEGFDGVCAEYSGAFHVDKASAIASGSGTAAASASISTTNAGELVIGYGYNYTTTTPGVTPETGFSLRGLVDMFLEDRIQATSGSVNGSVTYNQSVNWYQGVVAFAPTAAGSPVIANVAPSAGSVGAMVTVTGNNFGTNQAAITVEFNGISATPQSLTATSFVVQVPAGATTGSLFATVNGTNSNGVTFTVVPPPSISSISPSSGTIGITTVTITGSNFGTMQGGSVLFNGTRATPTSWSSTSIATPIPTGATSGNVVVGASGVVSNGVAFTVVTTPSITSLSPPQGSAGTVVTIRGANFGSAQGGSTVTFNGIAALPSGTSSTCSSSWSNTCIVVPVPTGLSLGNVSVVVKVASVSSNVATFTDATAGDFQISVTPSSQSSGTGTNATYVVGISPLSGFTGTVNLNVTGLPTGATAVFSPSTVSNGSGSSTLTVSAVASTPSGSSTLTITGTSGTLSHSASATLVTNAPTITGLSLTQGPLQMGFVITGANFGATQPQGSTVKIGSTSLTVVSWAPTGNSITVQLPASGAASGSVVVTIGGAASNGWQFTVVSPFSCN
jgi:hypothetical protein